MVKRITWAQEHLALANGTGRGVPGKPWVYLAAGLALIALSTWLLFGSAGAQRKSEQALEQGNRVVAEVAAAAQSLRATLGTESVQALATRALAEPSVTAELQAELTIALQQPAEARVLDPDILLLDFNTLGEARYILLDMLVGASKPEGAPVQVINEAGVQKLVAASVIGTQEEPLGFVVLLTDPAPLLAAFDLSLPAAGYAALELATIVPASNVLKATGSGIPQGYTGHRLPVPGTQFRVVVPQFLQSSSVSNTQKMALFVLGALLLVLGMLRRQALLRKPVELQPDFDSFAYAETPAGTSESVASDQQSAPARPGEPEGVAAAAAPVASSEELDLESLHQQVRTHRPGARAAASGLELSAGIFRAYDIRGIVGQTLDKGIAQQVGHAVGSEAMDRSAGPIVVGRDGRHSGPDLVDGLIDGLLATGCEVIDVGTVPTGALYFAAYELGSGSGVMVTGSHNPPDYNGFKIMLKGRPLAGEEITGLYDRLARGRLRSGRGKVRGEEVLERYRDRIASDIQLKRPLKVVADCGNGIGGICAPEILRAIGAEVLPLFDDVDGTFPNHHPDPSEPHNLEDLIHAVRHMNADIGVAFDGDADRLGVVTATGQIVYPDRVMMLYAREILERNPGATIIYDVKCTGHLERVIREAGGVPEMWKTGHSLIKNRMKEVDAPFAGEMSGHFFFKDRWYGFDCGIYSAARLLEILANDPRPPVEVLAELPNSFSTPELKVELAEGENHAFIERFQREAQFEGAQVTTIDGVRADFPFGWGLVRASNTTPVLVLRFDADSLADLSRVKELFRTQLLALKPDMKLPF